MYTVYAANHWKLNPSWPNGVEPDGKGNKRKIATVETELEAIELCGEWNATHKPGRLKRRASFTDNYKKYAGNCRS